MTAKIDVAVCERLLTVATNQCRAATAQIPATPALPIHEPNWEGVTTALTSMSTALTWGLFVLAIVGLVGLIPFVFFIRLWAKDEARKAAKDWFDTEAPAILKELNAPLNPSSGNLREATPTVADEVAAASE